MKNIASIIVLISYILAAIIPIFAGYYAGKLIVFISSYLALKIFFAIVAEVVAIILAENIAEQCQKYFENPYFLDDWDLYVFFVFGITESLVIFC